NIAANTTLGVAHVTVTTGGGTSAAVVFTVAFSLSCTPVVMTPGVSGTCTISLGAPAIAPMVFTLLATNSNFAIPASLTIATGAMTGSVEFTTTSALSGWALLSAKFGSVQRTFTFSIPPY